MHLVQEDIPRDLAREFLEGLEELVQLPDLDPRQPGVLEVHV